MTSFETRLREEARLVILRLLAEQADGTLSSSMFETILPSYGINRPRAWIHEEMAYLASLGAIHVVDQATVRIATITRKGRDHVMRRLRIEGVRPPSDPDA
jgi:hypothetical protein